MLSLTQQLINVCALFIRVYSLICCIVIYKYVPRFQHYMLYVLSKDNHQYIVLFCSNAHPPIWYAGVARRLQHCMLYVLSKDNHSCIMFVLFKRLSPHVVYAAVAPRLQHDMLYVLSKDKHSHDMLLCSNAHPPLADVRCCCPSHFLPMHVVNPSPPKGLCQWHGCHILVTVCYKLSHSHVMF